MNPLNLFDCYRKRRTFTTKHGTHVYDMGLPDVLNFTIPKLRLEKAEDTFLDTMKSIPAFSSTWDLPKVTIIYCPFPINRPEGYKEAEYFSTSKKIFLGLQPFVHKTAWAHEMIHAYLDQFLGDNDHNHRRVEWWESGFVGQVQSALRDQNI